MDFQQLNFSEKNNADYVTIDRMGPDIIPIFRKGFHPLIQGTETVQVGEYLTLLYCVGNDKEEIYLQYKHK